VSAIVSRRGGPAHPPPWKVAFGGGERGILLRAMRPAAPRHFLAHAAPWAAALAFAGAVQAQEPMREFSSKGLPGSQGLVVRLQHPAAWRRVDSDDPLALAELRGPAGELTGILQVGRGLVRTDMAEACKPEAARTMLQNLGAQDPDTRVTDVVARPHEGRPAYELRYERSEPPDFLVVRSLVVCVKDSKLLVSCAGAGSSKAAAADIEPLCRQVLESLRVVEE
jgi:hypothetical protein